MNRLQILKAQLQAWLDQLNSRERKLVTYGGALVAVAFTWLVLIEPAVLTIQQAPANQAALVDKAGQVMRAAQDLDALRSARSRVVVPDSDIQARLQQLLDEQGIAAQAVLVRTEEGDLRVDFNNVPASGFLAWLSRAEAISSLQTRQSEMEKTEAGLLKGYVSLQPGIQASPGQQTAAPQR